MVGKLRGAERKQKERERNFLGTGPPEQVEVSFQMHLEVAGSEKAAGRQAGENPAVDNFNDVRKRRDCPSAD